MMFASSCAIFVYAIEGIPMKITVRASLIPLLIIVFLASSNAQTSFQLDSEFARKFADDWIASWNSHSLERVLEHYTDDFVMSSLRIRALGFDESGTLRGKQAVGEYWGPSLGENSQVLLTKETVLLAPDSITIYYRGRSGRLAAEVFIFDNSGLVRESIAHYDIESF